MKREIELLIDKATRSIAAAQRLCASQDYDFAVSRAYYALFYVSEALLLKKNKSYSKHSAVITAMFENYIKNEELPKEFHKTLNYAFDLRQEGDYLCSTKITQEIAMILINDVEKQVKLGLAKLTKE